MNLLSTKLIYHVHKNTIANRTESVIYIVLVSKDLRPRNLFAVSWQTDKLYRFIFFSLCLLEVYANWLEQNINDSIFSELIRSTFFLLYWLVRSYFCAHIINEYYNICIFFSNFISQIILKDLPYLNAYGNFNNFEVLSFSIDMINASSWIRQSKLRYCI